MIHSIFRTTLREGGTDRKRREREKGREGSAERGKGREGKRMRYTDAKLNFFQFIPLPTSELKLDEYLYATAAPIRSKFSLFLNWK